MSRVPWHLFLGRQAQGHLVVAQMEQADRPVGGDKLTAVQAILKRLVRRHKPAGLYAVTVVREAGRPEVHLAFEDQVDALKLAEAMKAKAIGTYSGWASQRAFELDGTTLAALEAALPVLKRGPRREPMDESQFRRHIRRGARPPTNRGEHPSDES